MTIAETIQTLTNRIASICPIVGVCVVDPADKSTWRVDFDPLATAEQRDAAAAIFFARRENSIPEEEIRGEQPEEGRILRPVVLPLSGEAFSFSPLIVSAFSSKITPEGLSQVRKDPISEVDDAKTTPSGYRQYALRRLHCCSRGPAQFHPLPRCKP
jgi:hypothetical protein